MPSRLLLVVTVAVLSATSSYAQAVRTAQPYNGQLRTDPAVGNVQGIQRYGRPLKTDPDEGEGFSYHVYPVADYPLLARGQPAGVPQVGPKAQAVSEAYEKWAAADEKVNSA